MSTGRKWKISYFYMFYCLYLWIWNKQSCKNEWSINITTMNRFQCNDAINAVNLKPLITKRRSFHVWPMTMLILFNTPCKNWLIEVHNFQKKTQRNEFFCSRGPWDLFFKKHDNTIFKFWKFRINFFSAPDGAFELEFFWSAKTLCWWSICRSR